jgi:hypothetical protein
MGPSSSMSSSDGGDRTRRRREREEEEENDYETERRESRERDRLLRREERKRRLERVGRDVKRWAADLLSERGDDAIEGTAASAAGEGWREIFRNHVWDKKAHSLYRGADSDASLPMHAFQETVFGHLRSSIMLVLKRCRGRL